MHISKRAATLLTQPMASMFLIILSSTVNIIDTGSNSQDGSSEEFIGEWAESRGIRDQLVIATKVR
jgi:aryl-alcohol dehydrogenase-like predicted oxidoreductase